MNTKKTYHTPSIQIVQMPSESLLLTVSERERRGFSVDGVYDERHTHTVNGVKYNIWKQSDTNARSSWLDID